MTETTRPIRRALISVYDKTGLEELATGLDKAGVEIVSTGSTAAKIAGTGIPVTRVEELTGFPECLEGRVKTLHPRVHAGILADTRKDDHLLQLRDLGVEPFELVVVNLYPFTDTVASGADYDACVEQIDIGGPSMVRAAAKNHPSVAVVTDPGEYGNVITKVADGGFTLRERALLATQAFRHTASYDVAVASWLTGQTAEGDDAQFPEWIGSVHERTHELRYGENPHQAAAVYSAPGQDGGLANAEQFHGKAMSYNN
ncbi:MAG: bifunctional phosphoribosylaminoimidazolecarboxamide formyltransferase/IMP cyclohydrolase, partial [Mycobacteriaceae bacterium]